MKVPYATPAAWRRDRAIILIVSASQLIEEDMTDKQKAAVQTILLNALRLFFQAQRELRPGCLHAILLPFRTWTHRQGMLDYLDPAWGLMERIFAAPQEVVQIVDQYDRLYPEWYKALNNDLDDFEDSEYSDGADEQGDSDAR
jgi:hypothetical protein